jgi:hypothetical protein
MDSICLPTIATAAEFIALILLDLFRHDYDLIPKHAIFGVIITALTNILCEYGMTLAAWGFFILPYIIILIGWFYASANPPPPMDYHALATQAIQEGALSQGRQVMAPTNMASADCNGCNKSPCSCTSTYGMRSA